MQLLGEKRVCSYNVRSVGRFYTPQECARDCREKNIESFVGVINFERPMNCHVETGKCACQCDVSTSPCVMDRNAVYNVYNVSDGEFILEMVTNLIAFYKIVLHF